MTTKHSVHLITPLGLASVLLVDACVSSTQPTRTPATTTISSEPTAPLDSESSLEPGAPMLEPSDRTTAGGASFVVPAQWRLAEAAQRRVLLGPEPDLTITLVDVEADGGDEAIQTAWRIADPSFDRKIDTAADQAADGGWEHQRQQNYAVSAQEGRFVLAHAFGVGRKWTVALIDAELSSFERRLSDVFAVMNSIHAPGYVPETFAGRTAHPLDEVRLAKISDFVEQGREIADVPGVAISLVQDGKVVLMRGFGERELGKPERVGVDTLFPIGSNTKALTTLLLAILVDEGKFNWDTKVTSILPTFALGSPEATQRIEIGHLVCACTGLPRQDLEWQFEYANVTPKRELERLATMVPTTEFGEVFQYNNHVAAAAGFIAGHVAYPRAEFGAAYDRAMRERVFAPLGMHATTFDFDRALRRDHVSAHTWDVYGHSTVAEIELNRAMVPHRPAGAAWSTVRELTAYVQMELASGKLANGRRLVSEQQLRARTAPQVAIGSNTTYGMGLMVLSEYGTPIVHHGGAAVGARSDMFWLPEHGVGGVILTNADTGEILVETFLRRVLEVLFDGEPRAESAVRTATAALREQYKAWEAQLTMPPEGGVVAALASRYHSPDLGSIDVRRSGSEAVFDFGEWSSAMATHRTPDGMVTLVPTLPGRGWLEFIPSRQDGHRTLVVRDSQHEYVFVESAADGG